jgi:hypothetical protein
LQQSTFNIKKILLKLETKVNWIYNFCKHIPQGFRWEGILESI